MEEYEKSLGVGVMQRIKNVRKIWEKASLLGREDLNALRLFSHTERMEGRLEEEDL